MKILKVIVDSLPPSACQCKFADPWWNPLERYENVRCKFKISALVMDGKDFVTMRCPDCPLRLEPDEKAVNEVM